MASQQNGSNADISDSIGVSSDSTNAAIVVGIASSAHSESNDLTEVAEAQRFCKWVTSRYGGAVPNENVQLLISERTNDRMLAPTVQDLQRAIQRLVLRQSAAEYRGLSSNRLYVFVSGQGYRDGNGLIVQTSDQRNSPAAGVVLLSLVDNIQTAHLFDEVVMFASLSRYDGPKSEPIDLSFDVTFDQSRTPAEYFYAFATRKPREGAAGSGAADSTERTNSFFEALLKGLAEGARNADGDVTAGSLRKFVEAASTGGIETDSWVVPEFNYSSPNFVIVPRRRSERLERFGSEVNFAREATLEEDRLSAEQYAKVLARLFRSVKEGEFLFALYGPWGRGKSYLIRWLAAILKRNNYETVNFSAWKYPHRPEVWVHLYEAFANQAFGTSSFRLLPNVIRAGIAKHGRAELFIAYALSVFSVAPITALLSGGWDALRAIYAILGVGGVIWLFVLLTSIKQTDRRLRSKYLTPIRHVEKLGLQATIGLDLKALLQAWVPRKADCRWGAIVTAAITAVLLWFTHLRFESGDALATIFRVLTGISLKGKPLITVEVILMCLLVGATYGIFRWITRVRDCPGKVLLVVDDLDRCDPDHLLTIVESLKLLLEDPDVQDRVQVIMLLEEDILRYAMTQKYGRLADERLQGGLNEDLRISSLIRDNCEKLFSAHLRLPRLTEGEIKDLVYTFSAPAKGSVESPPKLGDLGNEKNTKPDSKGSTNQIVSQGIDQPISELPRPAVAIPIADFKVSDDADILHQSERDAIWRALEEIVAEHPRLGPRTVRSFLFRYQLARLLLGNQSNPTELATRLAERLFSRQSVSPPAPSTDRVEIVVNQVS